MQFKLKALTDIWTGGVDGKPDKLHTTGIKGSLRWWYEVLIRGLGSYACDPHTNSCKFNKPKDAENVTDEMMKAQLCPVCYLFGCTGWAAKGSLRVRLMRNDGDSEIMIDRIRANDVFMVEFIERKKIEPAEEILLRMVMRLIVEYGAIGAKTAFKPSEVRAKNTKLHHRDFGIIARAPGSNVPSVDERLQGDEICRYLNGFENKSKQNNANWPDLRNFWFVKGKHINRIEYNSLVGRGATGRYKQNPSELDVFFGGFIGREKGAFSGKTQTSYSDVNAASKKIFSFHGNHTGHPLERCFGYARNKDELDVFIPRLAAAVSAISTTDIHIGPIVIEKL